MALQPDGSSAAEQTPLPADVVLAWASLKKAKAVLQRLESGLKRQEWCHAGTRSARKSEWDRSGVAEPSQDQEDTVWKDRQARERSSSRCRLEDNFLERWDVKEASSSTVVGCLPTGSDSDSRRTRPPEAQQEPDSKAVPALALSRPSAGLSCSCPSQEGVVAPGALPLSFDKGSLASLGPASSLGKEASPCRAAPPPTTPSPVLENGLLAWQLEVLKENSLEDQKLQKLKARIQEQRRQCQHLSRDLPRGRRADLCSFGEGPQSQQHPLKRKVCKPAVATTTTAVENPGMAMNPCFPGEERGASGSQEPLTCSGQKSEAQHQPHRRSPGRRGRVPRMRKRPGPSHAAPVPGKAWKERGVCLFGASAWREGQRLARKILGPLLEPSKQRTSSEEQAVAALATGTKAEPGQKLSVPSQVKKTIGRQSKAVTASGQAWEIPPGTRSRSSKDQDSEQQPRPVSRKETAGPDPGSDCVQPTHMSEVTDIPARAPLLGDPRGPSANGCGRLSRSSQRSSPSQSPTSGKENQPASGKRWKGHRKHPYSLEEVREFMVKKVVERNRRTWEAKQASEQACEVRNRRLHEVYRKQRAAIGRKRSRVEAPQLAEGGSSATLNKQDHKSGQGGMNDGPADIMEWIQQVAGVLLRKEPRGSSNSSRKMARRAKRSQMPDAPGSLTPGGGASSSLKPRDLATPSPLPQCSLPQIPFLTPTGPSGWSLHRSTHDRIRAVQSLARELSARVESAVAQLRVAERPMNWGSCDWLPGSPALPRRVFGPEGPWEAFGEAPEAGALLKLSRFQSPSARTPLSRERTGHEEGTAVAQATTKGGLCSFSAAPEAGTAALPRGPPSEEKPSTVCRKGVQEGGASVPGFPAEGGPTPEKPRASSSGPAPLFFAERTFADSSTADSQVVLHQTSGMENRSEQQLEKLDLEKMQEAGAHPPGLQPGGCLNLSHHQQASGLSLPSANLTHSKAALTEESGGRSEATSQWSEVDQFYGSSGTFCRFGLTMAKQSLREEELHARHQSAHLRLWEQALREHVRAELAWLEHQKRFQGAEGTSVAVEKQDRVLIILKQEQAEIQHLQNICRAAHQRRKILLRQHKELLLLQQSTVQLWRQMCRQTRTPQHRADTGPPTNFEGAVVLGKEESTEASSPALNIPTCSGVRNSFGLLQGRDYNNLHVERGEILSPRMEAAGGHPEQKFRPEAPCMELLDMTVENLHSQRERATSPPPEAGNMMRTADREEEEHKEDPGLMTHPKKDQRRAFFNKESATNMSLESLASEASFTCLSPEMRSLQSDSEFHKAHAILISISGSSPSASDLEAEASQATDVSLPDEFVFQEPLHESCGIAGANFPDAPAIIPQISEENSLPLALGISCGDDSQVDNPVFHSQEKPLDDTGTYQSDAAVLSLNGMPRLNSPWAGGSLSLQADMSPGRQNAGFLNTLALLPCAENSSVNKVVFQGRPQSTSAESLGSAAVQRTENRRKQSTTSPTGTAKRDANNGQHRSYPDTDTQLIECAHEKNRDSISDQVQDIVLLPRDQVQQFPLTPSHCSKDLSVLDSRVSHMEHSAEDAQVSRRLEETTAQVAEELMGCEQAVASLSCAKTMEEGAKKNQDISATKSQKAKESEMRVPHLSLLNTGQEFQVQSLKSKASLVFAGNELLPEMEDDIQSPVDEVLTYGSADLPSPDASFPSDNLPAPPDDLSEKGEDSAHSTLKDFPPPPEQLLFPETGELEYCMDENVSVKTNNTPSLLLENPVPETLGPPLLEEAGRASTQLPSGFSHNKISRGRL